jgi:nucleoside phosphorylase
MRYIVTALKSEAQPIIDHLNLQKDSNNIYKNSDTKLIISGIGKLNSAIATTNLLSTNILADDDMILNFGMCGSSYHEVGTLLNINKIIDRCSDKVVHLKEQNGITISCYDKAQKDLKDQTLDMESFGFYQASKKFIKVENIKIIKIVSDKIDDTILSPKEVYNLIQPHIKSFL